MTNVAHIKRNDEIALTYCDSAMAVDTDIFDDETTHLIVCHQCSNAYLDHCDAMDARNAAANAAAL